MSTIEQPTEQQPDSSSLPEANYNRRRRKSRGIYHRMQKRSLKRRLTKAVFLAFVVAASLIAAYLLAG